MLTTGKKIKSLRENNNLTQKELANALGVTRDIVANWETDRGLPNPEIWPKLSNFFNIPIDNLLGHEVLHPSFPGSRDESGIHSKLPILGTIRAGIPILTEQNYEGYLDVPESIHADFALRVIGDSMIGAGILEGDYAICRENEEPQAGRIIVALHDEGSTRTATLKYYFTGNGQPKLRAANPSFSDIDYAIGYKCAGHMVALIREDAPGYQTYKDYLTIAGHEEWTEVIEKATAAGIKPEHIMAYVEMMVGIGKIK